MIKADPTPLILNGRLVADEVQKNIVKELDTLKSQGKRLPGLAVVIVGDNPASHTYVKNKEITCKKIGFYSEVHHLQSNCTEDNIINLINSLNSNKNIDGILVQLPLPAHIKTEKIIANINPSKDVDGLHPSNLGNLLRGNKVLTPCTPKGVIEILNYYSINPSGMSAVIIGRSTLVGKPLSILLLEKNATVAITHSKTSNIESITKNADILIAATGRPKMVKKSWIKPGAIVIDVGINRIIESGLSKLVGDVDYEDVSSICQAITPVPGGVGPVTIAMLMANTLQAYKERKEQ